MMRVAGRLCNCILMGRNESWFAVHGTSAVGLDVQRRLMLGEIWAL